MIAWWLALAFANPLLDAVKAGDRAAVTRRLDEGLDPNATATITSSSRGGFFGLGRRQTQEVETTALHAALERALADGDVRVLALLLARGGDPERRTASYPPLLHRVAAAVDAPGAVKVTDALLAAGADPTGVFRQEAVTAALPPQGGAWFVDRILAAGADPGALLCDARADAVVARLVAAGADVHGDCWGRPPLLRAVAARSTARVTLLLDAGADPLRVGVVDGVPMAALHVAAATGWADGVGLLVDRGADPNAAAGLLGGPPLALAADPRVAQELAARGATRSATHPHHGAAVWFARPVDPGERGAALASWATDEAVVLPDDLVGLPADRVRARVAALGAGRFEALVAGLGRDPLDRALAFAWGPDCGPTPAAEAPTAGDLRDRLGAPTSREVGPVTVRLGWDAGAAAEVWRRGHETVWVEGVCPAGGEALVGLPRAAVRLALGDPAFPGRERDRWEDGTFVRYVGEEAVAWGVVYGPRPSLGHHGTNDEVLRR